MSDILMMIVVTEALVEIVCKAQILEIPRERLKQSCWFLNELLSCSYCFSVWAGAISLVLYFYLDHWPVMALCLLITFHRLSNYLHVIFKLIFDANLNQILQRTSKK